MKNLILISSFIFGTLPAHAFLNPTQSQRITAALNDACGDAWCEGSYDIKFDSVRCSRINHNCTVFMELADSYRDPSLGPVPVKKLSCLIEPLDTADDVYTEKTTVDGKDVFIVPSKLLLGSIAKCIAAYQP